MAGTDHYHTLGVAKDASAEDIKKAFRKIAKENHPDIVGSDAAKLQKFKDAKEAYDVVGDADGRARYDRRGERVRMGSGLGFYRPPPVAQPTGAQAPSDLDLEDIFNDFSGGADFGFGRKGSTRSAPRAEPATPGRDIPIFVDVPANVAESGGTITGQLRRLGCSMDWSREQFTMDPHFSKAVVKVFVELHQRGLLHHSGVHHYRG